MLIVSSPMFAWLTQKRAVVIDTVCQAPLKDMLHAADRFFYHFQACPDSLFDWVYLGLEETDGMNAKSKDSRDAIMLRYKDRKYDPQTRKGDVAIDIYVLGTRWWKDQHLGSEQLHFHPDSADYPLTAQLTANYSGSLLEGGDIIVRMTPLTENTTAVHYEFSLEFGKVLAALISDKMWKNAIAWRFDIILQNLVEYAETGTVLPKPKKQN